jgi:hypothetical protein
MPITPGNMHVIFLGKIGNTPNKHNEEERDHSMILSSNVIKSMIRKNTYIIIYLFIYLFYSINTFQLLLHLFDHHQKITLYNVIKKMT